tara:strand:- start:39063 stop:39911 length:849 start_codon:yes stop_codon:yes gene_type:complete
MATRISFDKNLGNFGKTTNIKIPSENLLLDLYPNAALAYSLRKLSSLFSGNPIRVRRSNDNAEQDIPFNNEDLDTANLLAFVGSNDGYITTWYDQSGNGNNAAVTSAVWQAKIVSSGVVETDDVNGKPTSVWASNKYDFTNVLTTLEYYLAAKFRRVDRNTNYITTIASSQTSPRILSWATNGSGNQYVTNVGPQQAFGTSTTQGTFIIETYRKDNGDMYLFRNNVQQGVILNTTTVGANLNRFGTRGATRTTGEYQELIYWPNNMFINREDIYTNIDTYYQ